MSDMNKVLEKLVKLKANRDGEAAIGNFEAADAFARALNKMLLQHELTELDVKLHTERDDDPIIELNLDLAKHGIERKQSRVAWQERLASIVAEAHLCRNLIQSGSNSVWFVGTEAHVRVAEYSYVTLVRAALAMARVAYHEYYRELKAEGDTSAMKGFRQSWLLSFCVRIGERLRESRRAAVRESVEQQGVAESVALVRLDSALAKVNRHIEEKFKTRRAGSLSRGRRNGNQDGYARGRAAADRVNIGTQAVGAGRTPRTAIGG